MEYEIWKDIPGYEGLYQVSTIGNVRSLHYLRTGTTKAIKPCNSKGYYSVGLHKNSNRKSYRIHRLVAQEFMPNPENKPFINHINGIKTDNRLENLEWCTDSENQLHSYRILNRKRNIGYTGTRCPARVFSKKHGVKVHYNSLSDAERETGVSKGAICKVCKGYRITAGGYIWAYA